MFRIIFAALAAFTITAPAQAEDSASKAEAAWTLFSTHCPAFMEAETLVEINAALDPLTVQMGVTTDGAILYGSGFLEEKSDERVFETAVLFFNRTRIEDVTTHFCSMSLALNDADGLTEALPALVQRRASELLGPDTTMVGGPIFSNKRLEGFALAITAPGFPTSPSLTINADRNSVIMTLSASEPNDG